MKPFFPFLLAGGLLAAGGWVLARRRKYPLAPGLPPLNLFVVPAALVSPGLVAKGNATLANTPLPAPPAGIIRRRTEIPGPDATRLPLTLYEPEDAEGPLPCLVYLHGGGFCFADAGYIHENVMEYARLAGCRVLFVHYRTSEKAAFPAAFEDACAALRYAWDNAAALGIDRAQLAVGGRQRRRRAGGRLHPVGPGLYRYPAVFPAAHLPGDRQPDADRIHPPRQGHSPLERIPQPPDVAPVPARGGRGTPGLGRADAGRPV